MLLDDSWARYGRGRGFQFFLTDQELVGVLERLSSKENKLLSLIMVWHEKAGDTYHQVYKLIDYSELPAYHQLGMIEFFVYNQAVTGNLSFRVGDDISGRLSLSGLPRLILSYRNHKGWSPSLFGCLDKVFNKETEEVCIHHDYYALYRKLVKGIKSRLVIPTRYDESDPVDQSLKMSQGILDLYHQGVQFIVHPVEGSSR